MLCMLFVRWHTQHKMLLCAVLCRLCCAPHPLRRIAHLACRQPEPANAVGELAHSYQRGPSRLVHVAVEGLPRRMVSFFFGFALGCVHLRELTPSVVEANGN